MINSNGQWMMILLPKSFAKRLTLSTFVTSLLCVLTVVGLHLVHSYHTSYESQKKDLNHQVSNLTVDFLSRIKSLRMDAAFLASLPPVQGIRRAIEGGGKDKDDHSTLQQWKDRLATIFKEKLLAKPHYLQIRYIGVANKGKELVRVEWKGTRLQRSSESLLQSKGGESYFKEATKNDPYIIYLSDFSLNREWGKIETPPRMVLRAAVPIPDSKNKIFGVIVINMLAKNALSGLLDRNKRGEVSNIYDSKMQSLVTSTESSGWVRSKSSLIDDKVTEYLKKSTRERPISQGKFGDFHIVAKKIFYDPIKPERFLGITTRTPLDQVYTKIVEELFYKLASVFIFVIIAMFLLFLSIQKQAGPLQNLRDLAIRLSKGEDVPRPEELKAKDDELSELASAFYDMADEIRQSSVMLTAQKGALDETALVSETDCKGRITYANKKFADLAGFSQEELIDCNHRVINSGYHSKDFFEKLWKTIASGKVWRGEVRNKKKDGTYYWVDSSIVPFRGKDGKIEKYISIRFDITEKKEQEQQLIELGDAKSKFLAVMSHEIRTPLGAVIGLSELLASTDLSVEQKEYVNNIGYSADILLNILNDILDLAKLNSGEILLHPEPVEIYSLGQGITNIFKEKALDKKIDLMQQVSDKAPAIIEIDSIRFKQILINLVSNSIKFTDKGYIRINFDYLKERSYLCVEVEDSGIGMTQAQLQDIFNEFVQADSSTTKNYGGTGLGLPICKKIAEAMGGQISVSSIPGKGTTFRVEIPAKVCLDNALLPDQQVIHEGVPIGLKILLAEDFHLNQIIFKKMLEEFGLSVCVVDNGAKAFSEAEMRDFDLIFLDIQMPVMDGMEACQKIRATQKERKPWIVALTANAFREDVDKYGALGFDDYIPKPFSKAALKKAFSNFVSKTGCYDISPEPKKEISTVNFIDTEHLEEGLELGVELVGDLLEKFNTGMLDSLAIVEAAIANRDGNQVIAGAHSARGIALGFGMTGLGELLLKLEVGAKSNDWCRVQELHLEVSPVLDDSIVAVTKHTKAFKNKIKGVA